MGAPKRQHLMMLQRSLKNTTHHLSVLAPIVATPGLLKITLALVFCLYHRDELGTGIQQFVLGHHTSANQKLLKARTE